MAKRLDPQDRDILQFRPNIAFIEPEVEPEDIVPTFEPIPLENILEQLQQVRQLAKAVDGLAGATQARADLKAKNMVIDLDSSTDPDGVQAMARLFPGTNPNQITFAQYRECKDAVRERGIEISKQALATPEDVKAARDEAQAAGPNAGTNLGGFGTPEAARGGLRPELNSNLQIIPAVNLPQFQISMICILVNFIWKNFIRKTIIKSAGRIVGRAFKRLPKKICNPGLDLEIPGLFLLGDDLSSIPKPPSVPTGTSETR